MPSPDMELEPILKGPENYQIWKIRILGTLRSEKVMDVILHPRPTTSPTSPTTSIYPAPGERLADSWDIRDAKAHGIIVNHINVKSCETNN